ncbi:MAG TPA: polyphosphate kinase 2 family protein, partial [Acidimicrobiia bacterium]|nr:polyphosphate kinase 2 family protein [Acidimicrobiia bacterium]
MDHVALRIPPSSSVDLASHPTRSEAAWSDTKEAGKERVKALARQLRDLQEVFYAEGTRRLLVVLQAMDTGGKDSTIRDVFGRMNPQGVKVTSFKRPTEAELAHDYLWRVHPHVPGDGEIAIFNRSHYEDVLVPRVDGLVSE